MPTAQLAPDVDWTTELFNPLKRIKCCINSIARSSPRQDHHRALAACIRQVPPDWKRPAGRSSHTLLRAIEADLGPLNFGLATAWRKATTRDEWRHNCEHSNTPAEYALKEEEI